MTSARQRTKKRQRTTQRSKKLRNSPLLPQPIVDSWMQFMLASKPTLLFVQENSQDDSELLTEIQGATDGRLS
jgi:hypothetical protein